jgi:hypothetical protein
MTRAFGDVLSGNYTEFSSQDGTMVARGEASCWNDMVADLFGKKINSTTGKVDYKWDENSLKFQSGGDIDTVADRVQGNLEINHEYDVGQSIIFKPHYHWFQKVTAGEVKPYVLTLKYRFQRNGQAKTSDWITTTSTASIDDVFDFTNQSNGYYNQISRFPQIVVDCNVSDTLQFQLARTDSEDGDMLVYFFDIHGKINMMGSASEFTKYSDMV